MMPLLLSLSLAGNFRFDTSSSNSAFAASYGSFASSSQAVIGNWVSAVTLLFLLTLSLTRAKAVLSKSLRNPALTGLGILALSSCLWSQYPLRSLCYGVLILTNIAFAFFLAERFSPEGCMRLFMVVGWIVAIASIVAAVFFPGYGLDHRGVQDSAGAWVGIFRHKNWCAIMMAFLLSPALYLHSHGLIGKTERAAFIVLSLLLIWQTQSRTGWVVTAAMFAYFLCERTMTFFSRRDRFSLFGLGAALLVFLCIVSWQSSGALFALLGRDATLTGRTGIWQLVVRSAIKHPLLGYGFKAFWNGLQGESANVSLADRWIVPAAHNGFLDLWLELGVTGLLLFAGATLRAVREGLHGLHHTRRRFTAWCLCVVFTTIAANIAEGTIMAPNHLAWIIFVIACVGLHDDAGSNRLKKIEC